MSNLELDHDHNATHSFRFSSVAETVDPSLEKLYTSIVTTQYFNVALATVLIYSSIITMGNEVKYFWSRPFNSISLIYFTNRYIGLLGAISNVVFNEFGERLVSCLAARWTTAVANLAVIILIDYILLIRVLALYYQDRKLTICLKSLFGLEAASCLGMLIYGYLFEGTAIGILANGNTICTFNRSPPQLVGIASWCIPMAYGLILLILALYKATEYWKLSAGFKGFNLVKILIQDQIIFYFFVIFCSILKISYNRIFNDNRFASELLNASGSPTLLCVLGGHLLIHLKEAADMGFNEGTSYRSRSVGTMEFS